ncbi:hypothetical protein GCM10017784_11380 [Deinococcus indicus]|uniref:hypothetical protein n=1 Tax=Deinococcus indicus TaxID=223556 RepID=UPI00174B27F9|nr:hypothetical protein [Deinococcus indicus]GHG21574.1 hypothetical protein GCM10017784_11380 [Deinococcus indicus]
MTTHRTYGLYSLEFLGLTSKDVREIGWVHDIKWAFALGARPERKFELDHAHVLFGAADTGGLKLEICPRLSGEHLPGILVTATLQGNLTTVAEGPKTKFTTRVSQEALEQAGLTSAVLFEASCSLECTVGDMPTLEEQTDAQIFAELTANRNLQQDHTQLMADLGAPPLLTAAPREAPQATAPTAGNAAYDRVAAHVAQADRAGVYTLLQLIQIDPSDWDDQTTTPEQDLASMRGTLLLHWEALAAALNPVPPRPTIPLHPKEPGEDLPFPLGDTDPAAD